MRIFFTSTNVIQTQVFLMQTYIIGHLKLVIVENFEFYFKAQIQLRVAIVHVASPNYPPDR